MLTPAHRTTARRWLRHAIDAGARFDVGARFSDALAYCDATGTRSFVVPSRLDGTAPFARCVAALADLMPGGRPVRLSIAPVGPPDTPRLLVFHNDAGTLGYVQAKHVAWLAPLLMRGACVFAIATTGGTAGKPSRGVNIVVAGLDVALSPARRPAERASERAADRAPAVTAEPRARYARRRIRAAATA